MTPPRKRTPWGAAVLVALALVAVVLALHASDRRLATEGPSCLGELPDGSVWVTVGPSLWHVDANGRRVAELSLEAAGLPRAPANLVAHQGKGGSLEMFALPRGQRQVHVLDAQTGQTLRRIELHWPDDLVRHLDGSLWLAVHPDGRMAVANGGGHTVSLFDANGRFVARTTQGTYEFTNDLWWDGDQLWTTNTNGHQLIRLNGDDLTVRERLVIPAQGQDRFTALAVPHPRAGMEPYAPFAVLGSMRQGMKQGRVTFFWRDGIEKDLELVPLAEPRDLAWVGGALVVVEGKEMRLLRFDADRRPLPDLGDQFVQQALNQLRDEHERWRTHYLAGLTAAVVLLLAGALWAWLDQTRSQLAARQVNAMEARFLGTPIISTHQRMRQALVLSLPAVSLLLLPLCLKVLQHLPEMPWIGQRQLRLLCLVTLAVGLTLLLIWSYRWIRRRTGDVAFEGIFNGKAVQWLLSHSTWSELAQSGEHVRETLILARPGKVRWLVLSNRRLLSFVAGPRDRVLDNAWPRADIDRAELLSPRQVPLWQRLVSGLGMGTWVRITLADGTVLRGMTLSGVTARRLLAQLTLAARRPLTPQDVDDASPQSLPAVGTTRQAHWQVLASAVLPGAGQWWQRRRATALWLFVLFAAWMSLITLPVSMALIYVTTHVSEITVAAAYALPLCLMLLSAMDAWRFRPRVLRYS
jgi:hypothetical protein